jgi:hypothetical protein
MEFESWRFGCLLAVVQRKAADDLTELGSGSVATTSVDEE